MENFIAYNPVTLHFGNGVLTTLGETLRIYGSRVLLVYGKGSVKSSGLYDRIVSDLKQQQFILSEFGGIRSNPVIEDVDEAAAIGRTHNAEVILAVGGGSVIDSAKAIAAAIPVGHTAWKFFTGTKPDTAIPIIAVLTLAATGSEMNPFAVVSNHETGVKTAFGSPLVFPKHSFLDPSLTLTVPLNYTAYGIADLIAHCFEAWFGIGDTSLTDRFVISIVKEAMEYGPRLLNDLQSYEYREKIMFAATMALNGLTMYGRSTGDWGVHSAGHTLSLLYDVPHGASLTIVYPAWMRHFTPFAGARIAQLGSALFDQPLSADESINRIEDFFRSIQCPVRLSDFGISGDLMGTIIQSMTHSRVNGGNYRMTADDYQGIVKRYL